MGTMKIIGKAERKYTCDRMTISIHVIADEPTHDRAVQKCMNDSEALLKDLQSSGLELTTPYQQGTMTINRIFRLKEE